MIVSLISEILSGIVSYGMTNSLSSLSRYIKTYNN
jgi:hypothetical protein